MIRPDVLVMSTIWPSGLDTLARQCELHRLDTADRSTATLAKAGAVCRGVITRACHGPAAIVLSMRNLHV